LLAQACDSQDFATGAASITLCRLGEEKKVEFFQECGGGKAPFQR